MNNTALRAGAQSADNTHMVFADEKHEKFYYEKLEQYCQKQKSMEEILAEMERKRAENSTDGDKK